MGLENFLEDAGVRNGLSTASIGVSRKARRELWKKNEMFAFHATSLELPYVVKM